MGLNKPVERLPKSVKTAFQPLDQQDFHKRRQIALALHRALFSRPGVIQGTQWLIAGVMKIGAGNTSQRIGKNIVLHRIQPVEQRRWIMDLREPDFLFFQVIAIEFLDLAAGAAHHDVLEDPIPQFLGVFPHDLHISGRIVQAVQPIQTLAQPGEKPLQIG